MREIGDLGVTPLTYLSKPIVGTHEPISRLVLENIPELWDTAVGSMLNIFFFFLSNFWLKHPRLFELCYWLITFQWIIIKARNASCPQSFNQELLCLDSISLSRPYFTQSFSLIKVWAWNKMCFSRVWKSLPNPYVFIS